MERTVQIQIDGQVFTRLQLGDNVIFVNTTARDYILGCVVSLMSDEKKPCVKRWQEMREIIVNKFGNDIAHSSRKTHLDCTVRDYALSVMAEEGYEMKEILMATRYSRPTIKHAVERVKTFNNFEASLCSEIRKSIKK